MVDFDLKGEGKSGPGHPKVTVRFVNHIPATVTGQANVRCESKFQTTAELSHQFRRGIGMLRFEIFERFETDKSSSSIDKRVAFASAENRSHATPHIRGKARVWNGISQCERS